MGPLVLRWPPLLHMVEGALRSPADSAWFSSCSLCGLWGLASLALRELVLDGKELLGFCWLALGELASRSRWRLGAAR